VGGLTYGLALHYLVTYLRDHGPDGGGWSLRGNGAITLVWLGVLAVLAVEIPLVRRKAWLSVILVPVAVFLGLFVLPGTV